MTIQKGRSFLRALAEHLYLTLWEKRCRVCGTPCPPKDSITLCPKCAAALAPFQGGFCPCCGQIRKTKDKRRFFCHDCLVDPPPWQEIHFFGLYESLLKNLLVDFKFHGNLAAGQLIGELLARSMPESFHNAPHILVPMPLSRKRLLERGFNQVLEMARPVVRRFSFPLVMDGLIRIHDTVQQCGLSKIQRRINTTGVFAAASDKISGKHIILMDDIMTTGSTLRQAAQALLEAGASGICVLIAARTPKPAPNTTPAKETIHPNKEQ